LRFRKVFLKPGEEKEIIFELDPLKDLSFISSGLEKMVEPGEFELYVGSSSMDIR
jgi:beta-glucosidase